MIRLYHVPGTRSTRVLWLLEELGEPYDLTVLAREDRQTDEHRRRHPLGRVPVLEEDGGFVIESAAIALHLADLYPDAALIGPLGSHERALAYQWCVFAMTELEQRVIAVRTNADDADARERFRAAAHAVDDALGADDWLVGNRFGVADVILGAVLIFAARFELLDGFPRLEAYVDRLEERPARKRAVELGT